MRIVVSGAAGFVGAELLRQAADGGLEIVALTRAEPPAEAPSGVEWIRADLTERGFADALPGSADAVLHLAQSRRYKDFPDAAIDVVDVNLGATARLLDYARRAHAERFVLASTATVYEPSDAPLSEDSKLDLGSVYAASKRGAELLLGPYNDLLSCRALRIFTAYGPGQRQMLIADLIDRVRSGRSVELQGPDGIPMSPIHVSDVAAALLEAGRAGELGTGVKTLNVGGAESLTLREIALAIGEAVGVEPRFEQTGERSPPGWIADRSSIVEAFPGLKAPKPFAAGIRDTVAARDALPAPR